MNVNVDRFSRYMLFIMPQSSLTHAQTNFFIVVGLDTYYTMDIKILVRQVLVFDKANKVVDFLQKTCFSTQNHTSPKISQRRQAQKIYKNETSIR